MWLKNKSFYLFCGIFYYFALHIQNCDGGSIYVFNRMDFKGTRLKIDSAKCSNLPVGMAGNVEGVHTRGFCARLFAGKNCTGDFVESLARSPSHNRLGAWNFSDVAVSVGPCRDSCSVGVTGSNSREAVKIDVFSRQNFTGFTKEIRVEGCTVMPVAFNNLTLSIKTYGHCIQLYNNTNCETGNGSYTIELRQGTPHHEDISLWGFPVTKSISHCNYKCLKNSLSPPEISRPTENQKLTDDPGNGVSLPVVGTIILIAVVPTLVLLGLYVKKRYYNIFSNPLVRFYGSDD